MSESSIGGEPRFAPGVRELLIALAFAALTALMTWPWVLHVRDHAADCGDPYFVSWTLWWDFHQTFRSPWHLFNGNILYPYRYSLAMGEHSWGTALPLFPLFAMGIRPLAAQGVAALLGFAFSGYAAFRLARTLTGSTGAGWVAGIGFAFVPYRFQHLAHIPILATGWMALTLEAVVLYVRKPTWKRAGWLAATYLLNALSVIHWFVLSAIPLGASFLLLLRREVEKGRRLRVFGRAAAAVGAASLLVLLSLEPYRRVAVLYGTPPGTDETLSGSAQPDDWWTVDWRNKLWFPPGQLRPPGEMSLFPGAVMPILAAAALVLLRRPRFPDALGVGLLWVVIGVAGSFGFRFPFHRLLYELIPLYHLIRVPARSAMLADLGLALLAGAGAFAFSEARRRRTGSSAAGTAVFTAVSLLLLFELRVAPLGLFRGAADPDLLTRKIAALPMKGGLVELPSGGEAHGNYEYVLRAADHQKPLVNGVSNLALPIVTKIEDLTSRPVIPDELISLFEEVPVSYVTVRQAWLLPAEREPLADLFRRGLASGRLRYVGRFDPGTQADLWAVVKTEPSDETEKTPPAGTAK
ncbi:MAG: hypothetical protein ACHQPI_05650 [Thermoanaerobaculia bacterium]